MAGKKRSGRQKNSSSKKQVKTSSDFCREFDVQDVDLEYTDADYKNLTTFNLFVRLIRPQIAAANPKFIPASKMNQIMDAKWKEFQQSNPFKEGEDGKEEEEEEQGDDDDEEEDDEEVDDEDAMAQEKEIRDVDDDEEDGEKTEVEDQSTEEYEKEQSSDGDESGPSSRNAKKDSKKEPIKATRQSGGLRIRLSGLSGFGVRKSTRERKPITKGSRYGEFVDSDEDSEASGKNKRRSAKRKRKDSEEEEFEEERPKRKSRGKKVHSDDDFEDSDAPRRRSGRTSRTSSRPTSRASAKKRRKQESESDGTQGTQSSSEESSSSSDSDSSNDSDSSGPARRKRRKVARKRIEKPEKPEKPRIPGERKSERSRKPPAKLEDMTDRAFEKMLKEEEKTRKQQRLEKEKRRREAAEDKFKVKGKRGKWQDDGDDIKSGEESDHFWYCEICKDGGDLILCDGCPKSYHKDCLKIEGSLPEGEWKCPLCLGQDLPEVSEEEEEDGEHDHFCKECKEGGDLLLCDFCTLAYHMKCLNPPLKEIPEGDWHCPRCVFREKPPKGQIRKILTWRWVNAGKVEDELDHTTSPRKRSMSQNKEDEGLRPSRELYVKYKYHSFWDCEFIPELQVEVHQPQLLSLFVRKFDLDEAPMVNELASRKHKGGDPYNLVERYYKWGIKPDWLQIHRIITHERERGKLYKYLVKWRERPYDEATWEAEDDLPDGLQDWDKHVKAYWARRKEREGEARKKDKKVRKKDLKTKLDKQPAYIDKCGGKLHPYQLEGLNWMRFSFAQDTNVILADEMGLGKTIQAISFIFSLWKEGHSTGPFLITAPLSTVANWEREFEFWAPELYVVNYSGGKENRAIMREREFSYRDECMAFYDRPCRMRSSHLPPKFDVVLTSYEYPSMDSALLSSIPWSVLIIDEAHRLKNNQSLFFRVLSGYKVDYRVLLTGTPLQNNLEELFNLLNFLEPGKFVDMQGFLEEFATIGKEEQVARLHEMLAPHMLRRLKMDVLKDIPDKSEFIIRVELSPMQKKYYKHILTKNYHALNVKGYGHGTSLINIMMDLRKCCNHPYLFPSAVQDAQVTKTGAYEGKALIAASGKLILLEKMLKQLKAQNHRVLIFSQMTRVIDLLEDFLEYMGLGYERIDGSIMGSTRQDSIDRFNDPESKSFVFLLSTRAGGLGINLATADTVIIYDQDWNPHNDIQAFSRAHRIGQKNKVMIYRFVSRASVEEKITQVCKEKLMLSELVIAKRGPAANTDSLTKQEVNEILKFGAEDLFKDDKDGESKVVTYDEEAVRKMLDRTQQGEKTVEKSFGMNEYLRSFKVATYKVKEVDELEEEEEKEEEAPRPALEDKEEENDRAYWQRILGDAYAEHLQQLENEQAEIQKSLGKGKRVRKRINYAETALMELMPEKDRKKMLKVEVLAEDADHDQEYFSDYKPDESSSESEVEDKDDEPYEERECLTAEERQIADKMQKEKLEQEKKQKQLSFIEKKRKEFEKAQQIKLAEETLPPLLAKVNNNIEVLGFTARQRRVFLDTVMRFGIPSEDAYQSQWLVRDLRAKSERVFKAYVALFMRHLCEPVAEGTQKFADGVPVEGLSRQHVLTRIGMIALIKRKVLEYEERNGVDSMETLVQNARKIAEEKARKQAELVKAHEERIAKEKEAQAHAKSDLDTADKSKAAVDEEKSENDKNSGEKDTEKQENESESKSEKEKENSGESKEKSETETTENEKVEMKGEETEKVEGKEEEETEDKKETKDEEAMEIQEEKSDRADEDDKMDTDAVEASDAKCDAVNSSQQSKDEEKVDSSEEKAKETNKEEPKVTDKSNGEQSDSEKAEVCQLDGANDEDSSEDETEEKESQNAEKEETDGRAKSEDSAKVESAKSAKEGEEETQSAKEENPGKESPSETEKHEGTDQRGEKDESDVEDGEKEEKSEEVKTSQSHSESAAEKDDKREGNEETKETEKSEEQDDSSKGENVPEVKQQKEKNEKEKDKKSEKEKEDGSGKGDSAKSESDEGPEVIELDKGEKRSQKVTATQDAATDGKSSSKGPSTISSKAGGVKKDSSQAVKVLIREKPLTEAELRQERMRKIFWIADGGFTELHAVWNHEEAMVVEGREWTMWHRRHDFWLLTGVITHGYRHWQEILSDPRFEIINKAFRFDADRIKRAAFLNRRFQLLEQALVIEEQLRKAARENKAHFEAAKEELEEAKGEVSDPLLLLDQFACNLRKISHGHKVRGPAPDNNVHKAISGLSNLITDIRQITYKTMPSTLAMTDHGAQSPAAKQPGKGVIKID